MALASSPARGSPCERAMKTRAAVCLLGSRSGAEKRQNCSRCARPRPVSSKTSLRTPSSAASPTCRNPPMRARPRPSPRNTNAMRVSAFLTPVAGTSSTIASTANEGVQRQNSPLPQRHEPMAAVSVKSRWHILLKTGWWSTWRTVTASA
eukprot:scaffold5797_cov115-Isochrysis_galbana.AAC.9